MTQDFKPTERTTIHLHGEPYVVYFRYYPEYPPSLYDSGEPEEYEIELVLDSEGNSLLDLELNQECTLLEIQEELQKQRKQNIYCNFIEPDEYMDSYV